MTALEEFKSKYTPHNRLEKHSEEITDLISNGYSVSQVLLFLKEKYEIVISSQAVYKFIKKNKIKIEDLTKEDKTVEVNKAVEANNKNESLAARLQRKS